MSVLEELDRSHCQCPYGAAGKEAQQPWQREIARPLMNMMNGIHYTIYIHTIIYIYFLYINTMYIHDIYTYIHTHTTYISIYVHTIYILYIDTMHIHDIYIHI